MEDRVAGTADPVMAAVEAPEALARCCRRFFEESMAEAASWARHALLRATRGSQPDCTQAVDAALWLARISRRTDELGEALRHVEIAAAHAAASGDASRECRVHAQHAGVLNLLGETEEALSAAEAAQRAAVSAGDAESEAAALGALADTQWSTAQWDQALLSYGAMLQRAVAAGNPEQEAIAHGGLGGVNHYLGEAALERGQGERAKQHFRIAADEAQAYGRCAQTQGDVYSVRTAVLNHAVALLGLGDTAAARALLLQSMAELGARRGSDYALMLKNLGDVDTQDGRLVEARAHLVEALAMSDHFGRAHHSMACCESLSKVCESSGDLAAALAYQRRHHTLYVQVASKAANARASAMAVKFETARAKAAAEVERARAVSLTVEAERLTQLSLQDALTGVGNRRRFDAALQAAFERPPAARDFCVVMVDIDHFKRVNDSFSHQMGDAVLQRVAALLNAQSRRDDVVARFGGEEFALILSGLDDAVALAICERIRRAIEAEPWAELAPGLVVTASLGVGLAGECSDAAAALALSDRRLYAAKRAGRNRVCARDD